MSLATLIDVHVGEFWSGIAGLVVAGLIYFERTRRIGLSVYAVFGLGHATNHLSEERWGWSVFLMLNSFIVFAVVFLDWRAGGRWLGGGGGQRRW